MIFLLKIILVIVVLGGGFIYMNKDSEFVNSVLVEFFPNQILVHPGEPLPRVAARIVEQIAHNNEETDHVAIGQAYDDAINALFWRHFTGIFVDKKDPNAAITRDEFLAAEKKGVERFNLDAYDDNKDKKLTLQESRLGAFRFRQLDSDKSGDINAEELWNARAADVAALFRRYDRDRNGLLTHQEFYALKSKTISKATFTTQLDANQDNRVDQGEIHNASIAYKFRAKKTVTN